MDVNKELVNATLNVQGNLGYTPLIWAAINKDVDAANILINAGADVNLRSNDGRSPLVHAILENPRKPQSIELNCFLKMELM